MGGEAGDDAVTDWDEDCLRWGTRSARNLASLCALIGGVVVLVAIVMTGVAWWVMQAAAVLAEMLA